LQNRTRYRILHHPANAGRRLKEATARQKPILSVERVDEISAQIISDFWRFISLLNKAEMRNRMGATGQKAVAHFTTLQTLESSEIALSGPEQASPKTRFGIRRNQYFIWRISILT